MCYFVSKATSRICSSNLASQSTAILICAIVWQCPHQTTEAAIRLIRIVEERHLANTRSRAVLLNGEISFILVRDHRLVNSILVQRLHELVCCDIFVSMILEAVVMTVVA